jgi:nucleoside-diphosphate-sugar epimerase
MTGATGALGRPAVRALVDAGHEVRAVARDDAKAAQLRDAGAEPIAVDLFDRDALVDAVVGSDAILHLATNVPPQSRMGLPGAWNTHNRLRTETTRHLLAGARAHDVGTFVKESITFTYPDRGDEWIDESVAPDTSTKMLLPTLEGEQLVEAFTAEGGTGIILRFGLFYGAENRSTDEMRRLARMRSAPVAGHEDAYLSSIHSDDAATAVLAALSAPSGVYNVVDDEPLTRRDYVDAFAAAFDLPHLRLTPPLVMRVVARSSASALSASQRVSNRRFKDATGWQPATRSAREGWAAIGAGRPTKTSSTKTGTTEQQGAHR